MKINFITGLRGERILEINDAAITHINFSGAATRYNTEGNRNFSLIIDDEEIKDALINDVNEYGVGWKVKSKPPRDEDDAPFTYMPVKVKFNARGPKIYLISGNNVIELDEDTVDCLDDIEIEKIDLDIRAYDDEWNGRAFRSAYLHSMEVTQRIDRFKLRHSERFGEE